MSALTKVFVVVVTVLSLVLVAFTVSFIAQHEQVQAELEQTQARLTASQNSNSALGRQIDDLRNARTELEASHASARQQWRNDLENLRDNLAQATSERRQAQRDLETWQTSLERLSANDAARAALLTSMRNELGERREDEIRHRRQIVELTETVTTRQAEADRLGRQVRHLRERMVALQEQNMEMENRLAAVPRSFWASDTDGVSVAHPRPEAPIFGEVTHIRDDGPRPLVQINVGSVDGVQEGMQFLIHRDNQYRGRLVVQTVEEDAAVGYLQLMEQPVQAGDRIVAGGR